MREIKQALHCLQEMPQILRQLQEKVETRGWPSPLEQGWLAAASPGAAEVGGLCGDLLQTTVVSDYYIYGSRCMSLVLHSVFLLLGYTYAVR